MKYDFEKKCDILIAGAGMAGTAAALASARAGMKTILLEKTVFAGGLATTGMILHYLPLSDSRGNQVTFGIAEELLLGSIKYGPGHISPEWKIPNSGKRYGCRFSPAAFILYLDKILEKNNVDIWFDTVVSDVKMNKSKLRSVEVVNKSGKGLIHAKTFVDATGDADIANFAKAPCQIQDNFLSIWSLGISLDDAKKAVAENSGYSLLHMVSAGGDSAGCGHDKNMRKFYGTIGKDVSKFNLRSRELLRNYYSAKQTELGQNGRNDFFPVALPAMACFRTTRRIEAEFTLSNNHKFTHFDDCIGIVADWRGGHDIWEIPYRTLVPKKVKGLLLAGRCISSEAEAWEVTRVIQAAAVTGEVCGTASALAIKHGILPGDLDIRILQNELISKGFLLDFRKLNIKDISPKTYPAENTSHENFY